MIRPLPHLTANDPDFDGSSVPVSFSGPFRDRRATKMAFMSRRTNRVRGVGDDGRIPVALFDLDNTLFDRASAYRRWAAQYVSDAGLAPTEVEWFVEADGDGFTPRKKVWTLARERYGLSGTIEGHIAAYRARYLDCCVPDEKVHASLATLRQSGWRIGVVTNGPMPQQADKAARLGLLPLVDGFCASAELGIEKPDPRIFEEAIGRCAVAPSPAEVDAADGWSEMHLFPTSGVAEPSVLPRCGYTVAAPGTRATAMHLMR